jgi:membrane protein implicated in regulation of membrane protease activity
MEDWLLWLILAVVFGVGEIVTLGFFLAPFAGGAAVAAVVSAAGAPFVAALAVVLVVSVVLLAALRPLARSHRRMPPQIRTGTAALVGKSATVLERIANSEGVGCVRIDGEIWTARAYMDEETYEAGTRVQVVEIRGATALVTD